MSTAPEIYAFALRRAGHDEAEDVTAETYARAWRSLSTFRDEGRPFVAWLVRIAQNVMIDRAKRSAAGPTVSSPPSAAPAALDEDLAERDLVRRALDALPERQRQVLELRFIRDLSVPSVARAMGLTTEGVRALTYRALTTLRDDPSLVSSPDLELPLGAEGAPP